MDIQQARPMGTTEWAMLLVLSALWGSSFFFFKVLVAALPPLTVVLGRVGLAAVILNVFLLLRRDPMRASLPWGRFIIMGMLNNAIPFSLIVWGETRISSGLASILNAATPLFAVVAAHFLTRNEPLTWGRVFGVVFGMMGVAVLVGPDALQGVDSRNLPGEIACLLAALSYASLSWFAGATCRHRAAHRCHDRHAADCRDCRSILDVAGADWDHMGRAGRHCDAVHGSRVCSLLQDIGHGGTNQFAAGNVPAADQRAIAWQNCAGRTYSAVGVRRHGPDRWRAGGHRWQADCGDAGAVGGELRESK
jgi:hypothetical protein